MNLRTLNDLVACAPFAERGIVTRTTATGVPYVGNYDMTVSSVALADGPDGILAGDIIYVAGTAVKAPWARAVLQIAEGVKAVFVPKSEVKLVRRGE